MNKLILFCVETTPQANTDYLYIKGTIKRFYEESDCDWKDCYAAVLTSDGYLITYYETYSYGNIVRIEYVVPY